jgi:hypothetical protein
MSIAKWCLVALGLLSWANAQVSGDDPPKVPAISSGDKVAIDSERLGKLVSQLGSEDIDEREKAQKSLESLKENDLPALRDAAKKTTDAEIRRRLTDVIAVIEVRTTKEAYAFIEKVGGRVIRVRGSDPVEAGQAGTDELSVILIDAKFGDGDLHRLKWLGKVTGVTLTGANVTDRGLHALEPLTHLTYLGLDGNAVTDAGLAHLKSLTNLGQLSLRDTKVKGKGLDYLKDLKGLWSLRLDGCDITDDNLVHVAALTRIKSLSLGRTKVTDAGLARLTALPELYYLFLEKTAVTDAGLAHLADAKTLRTLDLAGTSVTADGVAALKKTKPKLKIRGLETQDK